MNKTEARLRVARRVTSPDVRISNLVIRFQGDEVYNRNHVWRRKLKDGKIS